MILVNEKEVFQDITEFLLDIENTQNMSTLDLYRMWIDKNGVIFYSNDLVKVALCFIDDAKSLDKKVLKEAYKIDREDKLFVG